MVSFWSGPRWGFITFEMKSPLPISVAMIAHNEAHNLPKSLGSVHGWVTEIVLVVNDCTDDTVAVAESFGARVVAHPWSCRRDQKNVALDLTTQPWVLALDADEAVCEILRESIVEFLEHPSQMVNGAFFARKTWFLGRWITHGEWYPDYSLRLIRRGHARWGGSPEHDKIELDGKPVKLRGDLLHHSFPDINTNLRKITIFADANLKERIREGRVRWSLLETLFRPTWRFFRSYVIRGGFLDGYPGFFIAWSTAFAVFIKYSRLYEHGVPKDPAQE